MSIDIVDVLGEPGMTRICAPMVRYSKLPFRTLVRRYDCDICFTPMILADSFVKSSQARNNEFTTNAADKPLVVQFAANNTDDFADAAEMVAAYSNGADLNCGCPQRWAMKEGYGSDLLTKPQLVKNLVSCVRNRISKPFSVSVKIRLLENINETIEMCRTLEKAGLSFLTIHARTPQQRREPINIEALKIIRDTVCIPVIANGDVKCLNDAQKLIESTNCDGVMVANGILSNPALFSGYSTTPLSCVQDWLTITRRIPVNFQCFHHHLVFMLEKVMPKLDRLLFNNLQSAESVLEFLNDYYDIKPQETLNDESMNLIVCDYDSFITKTVARRNAIDNEMENDFLGNIFTDISL